jgi:hypothetical protein
MLVWDPVGRVLRSTACSARRPFLASLAPFLACVPLRLRFCCCVCVCVELLLLSLVPARSRTDLTSRLCLNASCRMIGSPRAKLPSLSPEEGSAHLLRRVRQQAEALTAQSAQSEADAKAEAEAEAEALAVLTLRVRVVRVRPRRPVAETEMTRASTHTVHASVQYMRWDGG